MKPSAKFQWGPLIVGALTCLLIQTGLALLVGGIGLSMFEWEKGVDLKQFPVAAALVALAVSVVLSFFAGGYLTSYWGQLKNKTSSVLHGIAVWAFVSGFLIFFVGARVASSAGRLLTSAGIGASAASGTEAMITSLNQMKIVSDIKLTKGLIVTTLEMPKPSGGVIGATAKEAKKTVHNINHDPEKLANVEGAVDDIGHFLALASFALFGSLILGIIASIWGALAGKPTVLSPAALTVAENDKEKSEYPRGVTLRTE